MTSTGSVITGAGRKGAKMVLTREDLIGRIRDRIGEEIADADISLMEDIADTYDDLKDRAGDNENWREKYDELDKTWRQKYIDRFNGKVESDADFVEEPADADETILEYEAPKTYEELFEVKED